MMIDRGKENAYFSCKVDCCEFEISGGDGSKNLLHKGKHLRFIQNNFL